MCHIEVMDKRLVAVLAISFLSSPTLAEEPGPTNAEAQFAAIAGWEGRWNVAETSALTIVFEITARGKTVIERWETDNGLHSMTVYHLNGDKVMATHYCPQGNQPRLESVMSDPASVVFAFKDVTDLDEGESHTFTLRYTALEDGTLKRTEVYRSAEGPGQPSSYTLSRTPSVE